MKLSERIVTGTVLSIMEFLVASYDFCWLTDDKEGMANVRKEAEETIGENFWRIRHTVLTYRNQKFNKEFKGEVSKYVSESLKANNEVKISIKYVLDSMYMYLYTKLMTKRINRAIWKYQKETGEV